MKRPIDSAMTRMASWGLMKTSSTGSVRGRTDGTLRPGSDGAAGQTAWRDILSRCRDFAPQLVIVSAGFDAHAADPLAQLNWDDDDFAAITRMICDMAADLSAPVVSCLEGGYDLDALGRSARAHVQVLLEARE